MDFLSTPLILNAIRLHHRIQKIFRYSPPFQWSPTKHEFVLIPEVLPRIPWFFANFILLPWVAILNSSVVIFCYVTGFYRQILPFQGLIVVVQLMAALSIINSAYYQWAYADDWISFLNNLVGGHPLRRLRRLESVVDSKWIRSRSGTQMGVILKPKCRNCHWIERVLAKCRITLRVRLRNGNVDTFGLLINLTMLGFNFLAVVLPPTVFIFKLDAPCHFFSIVLPERFHQTVEGRVLISIVRILIGTWAVTEAANVLRGHVLYAFIFIWNFWKIIRKLELSPVTRRSFMAYRVLYVLFQKINYSFGIMTSWYLGTTYWVLVLCFTSSIIELNKVRWQFYVGIPATAIFVAFVIIFAWELSTLMDDASKRLKWKWRGTLSNGRWRNMSQKKAMNRMVKTIRPISIQYASLGSMTKSTRTKYLYSLLSSTVELTIFIKNRVARF